MWMKADRCQDERIYVTDRKTHPCEILKLIKMQENKSLLFHLSFYRLYLRGYIWNGFVYSDQCKILLNISFIKSLMQYLLSVE